MSGFFLKICDFFFSNSALREMVTFSVRVTGVPNLNSILVKRQIYNPSPGAGGKLLFFFFLLVTETINF